MKITEARRQFCIDVVNMAVYDNILEWAKIRKNSHNQYIGCVSLMFMNEDEEKVTLALGVKEISQIITKIFEEEIDNMDEDIEKNILYAIKRNDASLLESDEVNVIFQLACFGELQDF
jgi:hypothetical protein